MPNRRLSRFLRALHARQGRRSAFLVLFGAVYILLGYSYAGIQVNELVRHNLGPILRVAPLAVFGWAWIVCGAVCVVGGVFLAPDRDRHVFATAVVMPTLWSFAFFAAWLNGDNPRGWTSGLLFLLIAASVSVIAGMVDPTVIPVAGDRRPE